MYFHSLYSYFRFLCKCSNFNKYRMANYLVKTRKKQYPDLVVQSNELTLAKYNFDLIEKRVLYLIIDKVRKKFVDEIPTDNITKDLWGNLTIRFTPAELREVDNMNRIYERLTEFKKKSFEINTDEEWASINLVTYAVHKKKENYFEMEISNKALPLFVQLSERFTAYSLSVALSFTSSYTQRFYELCQMWRAKGYFEYSVDKLREFFDLETSYKTYGELKRAVIDKAQKELYNSYKSSEMPKSDVYFKYEIKEKSGVKKNKVKELIFYIYDTSENLYGNWGEADYLYNIRQKIGPLYSADPKFIEKVLDLLKGKEIPYINSVWCKIEDKLAYYADKDIVERSKVIRTILKEDFNIF